MKDYLTPEIMQAIQSREGIVRDNLIEIIAKDRTTGNAVPLRLWSGWDTTDLPVLDPDTRLVSIKTYYAGAGVVTWPAIPLTSDTTIRRISMGLSQINQQVLDAIQGFDSKHAPVQIHRLYRNRNTLEPIGPAIPRFIGFLNESIKRIPSIGGEGSLEIGLVSESRNLTKLNPIRRSDEQQQRRGGDRFRRYADVAGSWLANVHWGEVKK